MAKLLASSLNNFITLNNSHSTDSPYVTFTVGSPSDVRITIKDANNDDGYNKDIVGNISAVTSSESFNTSGVTTLNLMECVKLNSIFFNTTLESSNTIKTYIDTSVSYNITVSGTGISVGGTYSSYKAKSPTKTVVMLQGEINANTTNITMEKYNNAPTVSFNVTSPFQYTSMRTPLDINIIAYQMYDSKASMLTVPYASATIMPTTLSKFQSVDYDLYYNSGKVHFLTHNEDRYYNYGEHYGLSVLSDTSVSIKKNYYTNSGVFLESQTTCEYIETNGIRHDIYDVIELDSIEARYNHQVGYVDVYAIANGVESYPVRFHIKPKCNGNNEIFFLNEIGGIDSFNFTKAREVERKIKDQSTYFINPISDWTDRYELQYTKQKMNEITIGVSTNQINLATAQWLNELNKSKHTFKYLGIDNPKYKMIVVDKFDITTSTLDDEFEVSLEYHDADNEINI